MGTKNNPGDFDCYANADPDEPMFVLLGRDPFAPKLVDEWAASRAIDGEDMAKVQEAFKCADMMRAWLVKLGKEEKKLMRHKIDAVAHDFCAQEEVVSALWEFAGNQNILHRNARQDSPKFGVNTVSLEAVGIALERIMKAFGCEVVSVQ